MSFNPNLPYAAQQAGQQMAPQPQFSRTIITSDNLPVEEKEKVKQEFQAYLQSDDTTTNFVKKYGPRTVAKIYKQEFMAAFGNFPETYLEGLAKPTRQDASQPPAPQVQTATIQAVPTSAYAASSAVVSPNSPGAMSGSSPSILDVVNAARQPPPRGTNPETPSKMPTGSIPNFGGAQFSPRPTAGVKRKALD